MKIFEENPHVSCEAVKPVRKNWLCPKCMDGYMVSTGEAYMTNPVMYFHICNKCGNATALRGGERFPRIDYE